MARIKATILKKDDKKEFVILSYEDFLKIKEDLEDYEDLRVLRKAKEKEKKSPAMSIKEVKKHWGID